MPSRRAHLRTLLRVLGAAWLGVFAPLLVVVLVAIPRARLEAPRPTLQIRDRHGAFLGEIAPDERLGFWPIEAIPERVARATRVIEDRRFTEHPGVDPVAVGRALRQNARSGERVSGASTLAMQVARLQDPGPRTVPRKLVEAVTALLLTDRYGRERVMAQYLTLAPYGNNVHGIGYAARRYFDKPVDDLSWAETALLCALPQSPGRMNVYTPDGRRRAVARAGRILDLLLADGAMSAVEHTRAHDELAHLWIPLRPERPAATLHEVLALAIDRDALDGPIVRTTLDLAEQERVQALLRGHLRAWRDRGATNAAAVVVDLDGFEVRAVVGSADWFDAASSGAIDFARTRREPGSTLKPFLYAAALDRGRITPGTVLDDLRRGPDGIANADPGFLGPLLPRRALANSRNVPAVLVAEDLGLDQVYALFRDLGLHDDALPADHYGLGIAIGGMPTAPLDLARAATALTDGRVHPLRSYEGEPLPEPRRIFSEASAREVTRWLADPVARLPSFPRGGNLEVPFPAAFKTGTSPDWRDSWTIALTADELVVVWVGDPDWRPMQRLGGYDAAAVIARDVLLARHGDDRLGDTGFPAPEGWATARVCALTGKLATDRCDHVIAESFEHPPTEPCDAHVRIAIDARTGGRATEDTPSDAVTWRTFVDLPPRYAAWQARAGLAAPPGRHAAGPSAPVRLDVVSPRADTTLIRDPEEPDGGTLALEVTVDPPVAQVVWLVDGEPYAVVGAPYTARWALAPGEHTFQATLPFRPEASELVRIVTR